MANKCYIAIGLMSYFIRYFNPIVIKIMCLSLVVWQCLGKTGMDLQALLPSSQQVATVYPICRTGRKCMHSEAGRNKTRQNGGKTSVGQNMPQGGRNRDGGHNGNV